MSHTRLAPLDFAAKRDSGSASWERANPRAALMEQIAWNKWRVTLPGGEHVHVVELERDHGAYVGDCRVASDGEQCPGFAFHDGPCAHLCTLRKADFGGLTDVRDRPIRILDAEEVETERADYAIERAVADGGEVWL